jgi:hypothetical protein
MYQSLIYTKRVDGSIISCAATLTPQKWKEELRKVPNISVDVEIRGRALFTFSHMNFHIFYPFSHMLNQVLTCTVAFRLSVSVMVYVVALRTYTHIYICMNVFFDLHVFIYMYVCIYVCMYVLCMYVCVYVGIYVCNLKNLIARLRNQCVQASISTQKATIF